MDGPQRAHVVTAPESAPRLGSACAAMTSSQHTPDADGATRVAFPMPSSPGSPAGDLVPHAGAIHRNIHQVLYDNAMDDEDNLLAPGTCATHA